MRVRLENAYIRHQNLFLISTHYEEPYQRDPQKAFPCSETRHMTYESLNNRTWMSDKQRVLMLFSGGKQPPKLPVPRGILAPHLIYSFLDSTNSAARTSSRSVQSFTQGSRTKSTDTYTHAHRDRPTDRPTTALRVQQ